MRRLSLVGRYTMKPLRWYLRAIVLLTVLGVLLVSFREISRNRDVGTWSESIESAIFPSSTVFISLSGTGNF